MKIYKHISKIVLMLLCWSAISNAQTQKTISFEVEGLKVILRPTPKDIISARLFVRGGTANYAKDKEGIEALAFQVAMEGGTVKMDKVTFNTEAEKIGTSFGSSTSLDFGELNMTCIKSSWDKSWNLYADAILNPAFAEKEFTLIKDQMVSSAKQTESNPDGYLQQLATENTFVGRNYAKQPQGTATSLEKLTLDETKKYFAATVCKKRCYLIVVGNISQADLTAKLKSSIAKIPAGSPAPTEQKLLISKPSETVIDRDIATNYLMGIMSAPAMNSDDGVPMLVAMNILYDRFFVELRTKRSLSYAPAANYNRAAITSPYSMLYISTQKPKESMQVMIEIIDSVKQKGFKEKELVDKKQEFITTTYMKLETSAAQSFALGRAEMTGGYQFDDKFAEKVSTTTLPQINRVFKDYTQAIKWTYLGKKDDVKKEDFKQTQRTDFPAGPH
ncbi:MAG: pitrilysin family protein [Bacteroidia bacterium]